MKVPPNAKTLRSLTKISQALNTEGRFASSKERIANAIFHRAASGYSFSVQIASQITKSELPTLIKDLRKLGYKITQYKDQKYPYGEYLRISWK